MLREADSVLSSLPGGTVPDAEGRGVDTAGVQNPPEMPFGEGALGYQSAIGHAHPRSDQRSGRTSEALQGAFHL